MSGTRILIVGGGLGGLALAQGLKQAGIAFHIFERDAVADFRAQGYRIRIDQNGANALKVLLPSTLYDLFQRTSSRVVKGGYRIDASTGQVDEGNLPSQPGQAWNVDRTVLRQILLSGLSSEHITFNKRVTRCSIEPHEVHVHFADGTSCGGSFLVGADGIHSTVRDQLAPTFAMLDTTARAIFGKTPLASLATNPLPSEVLLGGITVISPPADPHIKLFCDAMRFDHTSFPPAFSSIHVPEDYLYWVLLFQTNTSPIPSDQLPALTSSQSATLAQQMTSTWHRSVSTITNNQIPAAASTLSFYMAKPPIPDQAPCPRATLLGDAAHPMVPVGGIGANAAFTDAQNLLTALQRGHAVGGEGDGRVVGTGVDFEGLRQYEAEVRDRANKGFERVVLGAGRLLGTPPGDQMQLAVSRTGNVQGSQ